MVVFAADRITKGLIVANIQPGHEVQVLPFLWLTNANNSGAAFGIAPAGASLFLIASAVVAVALVFYVMTRPEPTLTCLLLGLVLGGTLGNGYDRLVHGTVTDFVTVHWFPVFNVADSAISTGVALLLAGYLLRQRSA